MTELRFTDLQFTAEESTAFVRKALGDALDQDLAAVLHAESEGWAVGLQLLTLVAGDHQRPARHWSGGGTNKDLGAYLFGEVLALQPPQVQEHLLEMSVLGRFCASLCAAVCARPADAGDPEAWERGFVSQLENENLFVIALDAQHEFYRFHHLFQRFLAERLRERAAPAQIAALHRRASAWFAARGLIEEALDHALVAGDAILAADLVAQYRHDFYNREQFARFTRLLRLLPTEVKEHQPELLLAEARIATLNWRFTEAEIFLDHADEELARAPLAPRRVEIARGELAVLRGILDLWAGNAERLVTGLQYALQMLPPDASHLRGLAHMGITAGYWQQGDLSRAKAYLTTQLAQTSPDLPVYATLLQTQSFLQWVDGNLSGLLVSAQRLLTVSLALELPDQIALAHYFLGTAHFARGELEAARQKLTAAVAARFNLRLLWWCQAAGVLALTEQALGYQSAAQQTLAEAHDFLLERHALRILPNLGAFQAELDRQQGRQAEASAWAAGVEPGPLTWALAALEPALAQARVFLTQTHATGPERAAALIAELQAFCRRVPNRRLSMETDALAALLAYRRGKREIALDTVERLVREAEADRWVRLFVDLGEPMKGLLRELVARRVTSHALASILRAFPALPGAPPHPALSEPLSVRELEILALLRGIDSIKDIGTRLFIAPATVKRHTLNIYRKLEVNDRRAAVARASELGLFPVE
jgi:LuxR family maltose regulon positive regulatory protein